MGKIGIGVTTYNRPECLAKFKEQLFKHTFMDNVTLYVAEDTDEDRQGVAKRKNECLRALKDCDHIFLFDDDCYPIKDGWVEFFINNPNHWLFLDDKLHRYFGGGIYQECGGVFMYMTKKMVETIGAFDEKFIGWGLEHANYSQRIYKAGFNLSPYMCKVGTENYLYSEDYSNPNHKSSISNEEKQKYFNENFPKFKEGIKNIFISLEQ